MPLDFNTPVCQHSTHQGQAIPAEWRLEETTYGVRYLCNGHPVEVLKQEAFSIRKPIRINQHTQPTHVKG